MQTIRFQPFQREHLVEGLRNTFPQYTIQTTLGSLQVRASRFSLAGNVLVKNDPKTGKITTQTNSDLAVGYLFLPPLALYFFWKRKQAKEMELEVIEGLKAILGPPLDH